MIISTFLKQRYTYIYIFNTEFNTRGNLVLCRLKKNPGLRWFEPAESLVAKPSAVTKIKTAPQRAAEAVCVCPCAGEAHTTWCRKLPHFLFFSLKADNATAVSVRIQITNKCWTLLNALYTLSWVEHTIFWTYDDSLFILL